MRNQQVNIEKKKNERHTRTHKTVRFGMSSNNYYFILIIIFTISSTFTDIHIQWDDQLT